MTLRTLGLAAISAGVLATAGCATYDQPYYGSAAPVYGSPPYTVYERPATVVPASEYGVVESIDLYRAGGGAPTGLGAVIGNEVEKASPRDRYRIRVRLDSGGVLDLADAGEGQLRVGDRVRVVDGRVYRM